jgi:uncharacterized protein YndB with AHSA1/START domain
MIKDLDKVARLVRHFDASPERVFDAWLDPQVAGKWLFTSPTSETHSTLIDARVGGAWAITDRRDGTTYTAVGTYLEIDRPRRLVFEFGMPQFSPEFSRVIVELAPEGEGCILTLSQEPVPSAAVEATTEGWRQMLEALAASLAKVRGEAVC